MKPLPKTHKIRHRTFTCSAHYYSTGKRVWKVSGYGADGKRLREFFPDDQREHAEARRNALQTDWLVGSGTPKLNTSSLSSAQIHEAEAAFALLPCPGDVLAAARAWKETAGLRTGGAVPSLDDAWQQFKADVQRPDNPYRPATKSSLLSGVGNFVRAAGHVGRLTDLTHDYVAEVIEKRWEHPTSRNCARRAVSRFFSWARERPRRWLAFNPADGRVLKIREARKGVPEILTPEQIRVLLEQAAAYRGGKFLSFVVLGLFCGLRPKEAVRAARVSLTDAKIHLAGADTKTWRPRTVDLPEAAVAWLQACPAGPVVDPQKARAQWNELRTLAGLAVWPNDVLRHTAISYHFRLTNSFGLTALWAGNSEGIIKAHYQGHVSAQESAGFWALRPRTADRKIVRFPKAKRGSDPVAAIWCEHPTSVKA